MSASDYIRQVPPLPKHLTHAALVAIAQNEDISTDALIQEALGEEPRALLVLQQRVTREVFDAACDLCQAADPAKRQLGAKILREFPGLDFDKPFKDEALQALEALAMKETDESVLVWAVSAIGWQLDLRAIPLLLRFVDHPNDRVRFMVSSNLILNAEPDNPFPPEVAAAYQQLCFDPDEDVRWYAYANFADIAEDKAWVFHHESQQQDFLALLQRGCKDKSPGVREQAHKALHFFSSAKWGTEN